MHDLLIISPHLLLTLGILLCFAIGACCRRPQGLYALTLTITILATVMTLAAYPGAMPVNTALGAFLDTGPLVGYFLPLLGILSIVIVLVFSPYLHRTGQSVDEELYALFLTTLLGGMLLAGGKSWIAFFLGLELLSLPLYVLIAVNKDSAGSEAAIKYFVMGASASAILLFGIALVYAGSGSLDIAASLDNPRSMHTALFGLGLILAGVSFKLSLAPFHLWAPDVYRGAPAAVAALLTSSVKVAVGAGLLRIVLSMSPQFWPAAVPVLWGLAGLSMLVANLAALVQTSVKRMLGFSSAAHMGYMLMGVLCLHESGAGPILFYSAALAVMDLGAFGALAMLGMDEEKEVDSLESLHGLAGRRPWSSGLLAVSLAALGGLPPTAGFTGKLLLFRAAIHGGYVWLAVLGIIGAAVSVFYYVRALAALYLSDQTNNCASARVSVSHGVAIVLILVALFGLGLIPSPILDAAGHLRP